MARPGACTWQELDHKPVGLKFCHLGKKKSFTFVIPIPTTYTLLFMTFYVLFFPLRKKYIENNQAESVWRFLKSYPVYNLFSDPYKVQACGKGLCQTACVNPEHFASK